jgi:hypothetical protein
MPLKVMCVRTEEIRYVTFKEQEMGWRQGSRGCLVSIKPWVQSPVAQKQTYMVKSTCLADMRP